LLIIHEPDVNKGMAKSETMFDSSTKKRFVIETKAADLMGAVWVLGRLNRKSSFLLVAQKGRASKRRGEEEALASTQREEGWSRRFGLGSLTRQGENLKRTFSRFNGTIQTKEITPKEDFRKVTPFG
jgi:hypothetical protein